jgi:hypothetical protein
MTTKVLPLFAVMLVLTAGLAVPATASQSTTAPIENATVGSTSSSSGGPSAGAFLSGALSNQRSQIEGSIAVRTLEVRLERANTAADTAAILAEYHDSTKTKLDALEQRRNRLREAREAGRLSQGQYRHELAEISAQAQSAKAVSERGSALAPTLPKPAKRAGGLGDTQFTELQTAADDLRNDVDRDATVTIGPRKFDTGPPGIERSQRVPGTDTPITVDGLRTTVTPSDVATDPSLTATLDDESTPQTTQPTTESTVIEVGLGETTTTTATETTDSIDGDLTTVTGDAKLIDGTVVTPVQTQTAVDATPSDATGTTLPESE